METTKIFISTSTKLILSITKTNWIIQLFFLCIALLAPTKNFVILSLIFIFFDLVVGLIAAKKRKEEITGKGVRLTIGKIFTYIMVIEMIFLFEKYILETDYLKLMNIVTGIILLTEIKSITEKLEFITGNKIFSQIYNVVYNTFVKNKNLDDKQDVTKN